MLRNRHPLSLARQRARHAKPRITRYLSPEPWVEVKTYIQGMSNETARERERYARVRWLFTLLYLGGLRITEVGENTIYAWLPREATINHDERGYSRAGRRQKQKQLSHRAYGRGSAG